MNLPLFLACGADNGAEIALSLLVSVPLLIEYEAMSRAEHLDASGLSTADVGLLLDALATVAAPDGWLISGDRYCRTLPIGADQLQLRAGGRPQTRPGYRAESRRRPPKNLRSNSGAKSFKRLCSANIFIGKI